MSSIPFPLVPTRPLAKVEEHRDRIKLCLETIFENPSAGVHTGALISKTVDRAHRASDAMVLNIQVSDVKLLCLLADYAFQLLTIERMQKEQKEVPNDVTKKEGPATQN